MASSDTAVTGLAELQAFLDQLAPNVEKKLMRGALRAGQTVVANYAKGKVHTAAPSGVNKKLYGAYAGALRDSIRVVTSARGGKVVATVKAGNKTAYYARWVEYGTVAHLIKAKNGGALSFGGREYSSLNHPGAHKNPFMRPALDMASNGESAAFQAVSAYLQGKITKELASLPDETK